jgi:hypothetical protein
LLRGLSGRVLEVGAGTGINFPHYPAGVRELVAVEPEEYLRSRAEESADRLPLDVRVVDGLAECPIRFGLVRCRGFHFPPGALAFPVAPRILGVARRR